MNKRGSKNWNSNFWAIFFVGKKGMEMWQLILIILAVILLLFMLVWYKFLGNSLADLFGRIGGLF